MLEIKKGSWGKIFTGVLVFIFIFPLEESREEEHNKVKNGYVEQIVYADWFGKECLRIDLYHTADAKSEVVGLDEIVVEPKWVGTTENLIDPFDYGNYRFKVFDGKTKKLIYKRGFCTLLSEWRTTPESQYIKRTMGESLRMPLPLKPVIVVLEARGKNGEFHEIFHLGIDPSSTLINRTEALKKFEVISIMENDLPPSNRVDITILPEGYTKKHREKMIEDAKRFGRILFSSSPFSKWKEKFAINLVVAFSEETGSDEPRKGIFRDTVLDTSFNTFNAERYLTTANNKIIREIGSYAPYDVVVIMVNSSRYGGGGIYNFWSIYTSDGEYSDYVALHEFGHLFAGLGDEYFSSGGGYDEDEFYPPGVEPWEPNLSAFLGKKREGIKWKDMILPDVPLPTPPSEEWKGKVGLFEGAGYKSKGLYRGFFDCRMFHKGSVPFCPVCEKAIEKMIQYYTGKINP